MTSRERVLETIGHRKTDRIPADYGAHQSVSDALIGKLGLADYEELMRCLEVDMRYIGAQYYQPETGPDSEGYLTNMWGLRHLEDGSSSGCPFTARDTSLSADTSSRMPEVALMVML